MPQLISPANVEKYLQKKPEEVPVEQERLATPPGEKPIPLARGKVIPRSAVSKVEPFNFFVPPSADVSSREGAMQRKASAMNPINVYDVQEFLQKMAQDIPDFRNLPNLNLDVDKVKRDLGMNRETGGLDVEKVKGNLKAQQPKIPKIPSYPKFV